jgi:hypothetical protein
MSSLKSRDKTLMAQNLIWESWRLTWFTEHSTKCCWILPLLAQSRHGINITQFAGKPNQCERLTGTAFRRCQTAGSQFPQDYSYGVRHKWQRQNNDADLPETHRCHLPFGKALGREPEGHADMLPETGSGLRPVSDGVITFGCMEPLSGFMLVRLASES